MDAKTISQKKNNTHHYHRILIVHVCPYLRKSHTIVVGTNVGLANNESPKSTYTTLQLSSTTPDNNEFLKSTNTTPDTTVSRIVQYKLVHLHRMAPDAIELEVLVEGRVHSIP